VNVRPGVNCVSTALTAVVAGILLSPALATASPALAPVTGLGAGSASAAPAPTYRPVWLRHPPAIRAGSTVRLVLDPVSAERCRISLSGPRPSDGQALQIAGGGRLAHLTVRTRPNARPGTWRLSATCAQRSGPELRSTVRAAVTPGARRGHGILASRADIRIRRSSPFADRGRAGRVSGRGAGANPFPMVECTSLAYERRQDVYDRAVAAGVRPSGLVDRPAFSQDYQWNGKRWSENARRAGIPTGTQPIAGALFVNTTGSYGHVAYVEKVFGDGSFEISERNATGNSSSSVVTTRTQYPGRPGVEFVYGGPAAGAEFAGHIVQWDGDTKAQRTAWYVVVSGGHARRNWIPDSATFYCLKRRGAPGPDVLPSEVLSNALPDEGGVHASCHDGAGGSDSAPAPTPPPPPSTPTTLTVSNRVTNGSSAMREDTPAYLSTVRQNYCRRDGCVIAGTDRASGGTYTPAVCQAQGARTTNGDDGNANDDGNPGLFSSTRWYGVRLGDGAVGYISEVWIDPSQRGGLGLTNC
jgi:hypothetical protein